MLFCFSIIFYVLRRGFFIVCVCVVQIRAKCVLPLLLACFVALWLPYKYFSFPYVCFFKEADVNKFPVDICFCSSYWLLLHLFVLFQLSFTVITSLCNVFAFLLCLCVLTRIISPSLLSKWECFVFMRLCECEYLFLNLMHFALTCKNVCVRVQLSMKVTVNEYVFMCDLTVLTFLRFFFSFIL